jgi:L-lactate dehydrogenase complex protein LldG
MLERIRQALGRDKNRSWSVSEAGAHAETPADSSVGAMLPPIAPEELVPKFEEELGKVGGVCHRASTPVEIGEITGTIMGTSGATSAVLSRNPLLVDLRLPERLRSLGLSTAVWPSAGIRDAEVAYREQCFQATVGITGVDFALAESGSLVLTSATEGTQLASLAPPVHIAFYRRQQVVAFLEEVLEKLAVARNPGDSNCGRSVVFVTGPSRTADIEQILIRGVHGPREVHAILVEDSCLA